MAFQFIRFLRTLRGRRQVERPTGLAFSPKAKKYRFKKSPGRYTYIPPELPEHFPEILAHLKTRPHFAIIVAVYNTSPALLKKMLHSVYQQWYPHWQLILVNDASANPATVSALKKINHAQAAVLNLPHHVGISAAINAGIDSASADYVVFLDHEDELTKDCLYELALAIHRDNADFIYSDEDKLNEQDDFIQPHFKPDWSPDTIMSTMFTCNVFCVRRVLLQEVGGFRSEYDGCHDWDLVLRVSECTKRISHIAKVLYHGRLLSFSDTSKRHAEVSRLVREDALRRRHLSGQMEPLAQAPGYFRVAYDIQGTPLISIIILAPEGGARLTTCVNSLLLNTSYAHYELIIVGACSLDVEAMARATSQIKLVPCRAPFNFSQWNNAGVEAAAGTLLLFLSEQMEITQTDWLQRLGGFAQLDHIGAVGAKLVYPDQKQIHHAGILNLESGPQHAFSHQDKDSPGYFMRNLLEYNWLAVSGACLMISREKWMRAGGFDPRFALTYSDTDLCLRVYEAGYYNIVCQAVALIHHDSEAASFEAEQALQAQAELQHFYGANPKYFQYDPFYNQNLHPDGTNFDEVSS